MGATFRAQRSGCSPEADPLRRRAGGCLRRTGGTNCARGNDGLHGPNCGTYGIPYRALRVKDIDNLLAADMLITSDHDAHMSTRNTVCCMGQGQAAGTAAALCAPQGCTTRALPFRDLRQALEGADVHFSPGQL
ncbi:MAG: FAD-dependent oxidoreductase [Lentisphaerales bacterium]|nr:MAG: FAD-dependent oxidoreductase [Lentisphaerales bacterium]